MKFQLYEVLGLARDASEAQIKRAYRKLAKRLHPDVGGDPAKFAEINLAHELLTDAARRDHYDLTGDDLPKTPPDEVQVKAQDLIRDLIGHILRDGDDDLASAPIISLMRDHLKKAQKELDARIKQAHGIKTRAEKLAGRFKRKGGDGDNIIAALVRGHIKLAEHAIKNNEAGKPILARAIDIVTDHTFDPELLLPRAYAVSSSTSSDAGFFGLHALLGGRR